MPSKGENERFIARALARHDIFKRFSNPTDSEFPEAALLLYFLRFVEDNAASFDVSFAETERLDAIGHAYGTAFFPITQLPSHVAKIAGRLGMDEKAFSDFSETLAPSAFKQAFAGFKWESGDLSLNRDENIGKDLFFYISNALISPRPATFVSGHELAPLILKELVENHQPLQEAPGETIESVGAAATLSIYNPTCGDGDLLCLSVQHLASYTLELSACDPNSMNVVIASMRLLFLGYRGDYNRIRKGATVPCVGIPDAVMTEFHLNREINFDDFRNCMKLVSRGKFGFLFGEFDSNRNGDTAMLARIAIAKNKRCATHTILLYAESSLTVLLPADSIITDDIFLVQATRGDKERGVPTEDKFLPWLASVIAQQRDIPTLSAHVAREEILAQENVSLDLADYMDINGLSAPLVATASLGDLAQRYKQATSAMQEADNAFAAALEQLSKTEAMP